MALTDEVSAAIADAMRGFGRKPEQRLDSLTGAAPRPGFDELP